MGNQFTAAIAYCSQQQVQQHVPQRAMQYNGSFISNIILSTDTFTLKVGHYNLFAWVRSGASWPIDEAVGHSFCNQVSLLDVKLFSVNFISLSITPVSTTILISAFKSVKRPICVWKTRTISCIYGSCGPFGMWECKRMQIKPLIGGIFFGVFLNSSGYLHR